MGEPRGTPYRAEQQTQARAVQPPLTPRAFIRNDLFHVGQPAASAAALQMQPDEKRNNLVQHAVDGRYPKPDDDQHPPQRGHASATRGIEGHAGKRQGVCRLAAIRPAWQGDGFLSPCHITCCFGCVCPVSEPGGIGGMDLALLSATTVLGTWTSFRFL